MFMEGTLSAAIAKANRLAKKNDREYFVVREAGELDVCDALTLDTFYMGINDRNILYCTAD